MWICRCGSCDLSLTWQLVWARCGMIYDCLQSAFLPLDATVSICPISLVASEKWRQQGRHNRWNDCFPKNMHFLVNVTKHLRAIWSPASLPCLARFLFLGKKRKIAFTFVGCVFFFFHISPSTPLNVWCCMRVAAETSSSHWPLELIISPFGSNS